MKNVKSEQKPKAVTIKKNNDKFNNIPNENEEKEIEEIYNPKLDPKQIISFDYYLDLVYDIKYVDLVFLIDSTASMNCYSASVNKIILKIIYDLEKNLSKFFLEEIDILKIGIISYRDHDDEEKTFLTNIETNLTNDIKGIKNILMNIHYSGGKDEPEAVLDGLNSVLNDISWREKSTKFLVHILDAPCHGNEFHGKGKGFFDFHRKPVAFLFLLCYNDGCCWYGIEVPHSSFLGILLRLYSVSYTLILKEI